MNEKLTDAIEAGVKEWQEGNCHEPECGCVAEYVKKHVLALAEKPAERPAGREYPHNVFCSADRRFPAGEPGHSCSCLNMQWPAAERPQLSAEQRASDWLTPEWLLDVLHEYAPNAAKAMGWQTLKQVADALAMPGNTKPAPAAPPVLQAEPDVERVRKVLYAAMGANIDGQEALRQMLSLLAAIRREAERAAFEKAAQELQELAYKLPHEQSEDPADGMIPTEGCAHCQILLTVIPAVRALADSPVSGPAGKEAK